MDAVTIVTSAIVGIITSAVTAYITTKIRSKEEFSRWSRDLSLKITEAKGTAFADDLSKQVAVGFIVYEIDGARKRKFLPPDYLTYVGRNPTADIYIPSATAMSGEHFAIRSSSSAVYAMSLHAVNPVKLNGVIIEDENRLEDGDALCVGETCLYFHSLPSNI